MILVYCAGASRGVLHHYFTRLLDLCYDSHNGKIEKCRKLEYEGNTEETCIVMECTHVRGIKSYDETAIAISQFWLNNRRSFCQYCLLQDITKLKIHPAETEHGQFRFSSHFEQLFMIKLVNPERSWRTLSVSLMWRAAQIFWKTSRSIRHRRYSTLYSNCTPRAPRSHSRTPLDSNYISPAEGTVQEKSSQGIVIAAFPYFAAHSVLSQ